MLTYERLHQLFWYDPDTGTLWHKPRGIPKWDARFADRPAGTLHHDKGTTCYYVQVTIDRKKYRAHRIIWWMVTGELPSTNIDHEDHNGLNNRWSNLREAGHSENQKNLSKRRDNTTGITGVVRHREKFVARIQVNNKGIYLGIRDTIEGASELREQAEIKYGFHENHGK